MGTRHGVAVHVHPPWGRPIAQTAGTGRRSSTNTLSTENPPSRSRSASSFPRSRARSGAEWRASQKRYGLTLWEFRPLVQDNGAIGWKLMQTLAEELRAAEQALATVRSSSRTSQAPA